jgi:hypothetical protein
MSNAFLKLATAAAFSLCASFAMAQTTPAPAPKPAAPAAAPAATPKAKPPRTAKSLECSKEADTKGLHGKKRKHFMSACKKGKPTG